MLFKDTVNLSDEVGNCTMTVRLLFIGCLHLQKKKKDGIVFHQMCFSSRNFQILQTKLAFCYPFLRGNIMEDEKMLHVEVFSFVLTIRTICLHEEAENHLDKKKAGLFKVCCSGFESCSRQRLLEHAVCCFFKMLSLLRL